jgi:predicted RNase H-like HicB family nuclease
MEIRNYTVKVVPAEKGGYWAYVPALPGCFTQGKNLVEIERRAHEAIEGFIEVLAERGKPIPVEKHHTRRFTLNIQVKTPARA